MLFQVSTLKRCFSISEIPGQQWQALSLEFPTLEDIVVRCAEVENLSPYVMQQKLICLYQAYATEWDTVKAQISASLSPPVAEDKSLVNVQ